MRGWLYTITFKKVNLFLSVGMLILAGTACNYNTQKQNPAGPAGQATLSDDALISYETVANYSMSTCKNCHAGVSQPTLDSVDLLRSNISKVMTATEGNKMPPAEKGYSSLSDCQKSIMKKWVDLGMPESSSMKVSELPECKTIGSVTPPPIIPIELMPLNYETLNTRILQKKCLSCHTDDSDSDAKDYPFYPYQALVDEGMSGYEWRPPAIKSKVYRDITASDDDDDLMPPLDSGQSRLNQNEIDFIVRWIDAGRPEK